MRPFARSDTSIIARWWWSVDKVMLGAIAAVIVIGILLNFSASPVMAPRIGLSDNYALLKKQLMWLPISFLLMIVMAFQAPKTVRRIALLVLFGAFVLTIATLFIGESTKGSQRWISLFGFSCQPSEFLKPSFAIISAWLLAMGRKTSNNRYTLVSMGLLVSIMMILLMQPDMGMTFTIVVIWAAQFFLAGISLFVVLIILAAVLVFGIASYFFVPHFQFRINNFLNPEDGATYQVDKAERAFSSGGLFGTGPGEGVVKSSIPDAHTDFIMAVAGEEFGFLLCMLIIVLFALIIFRGFAMAMKENDLFSLIAVAGLLIQFGWQAVINMSSTFHLIPTKGMTLPFISYGGSSLVSIGFAMGMVLALTRKRTGGEITE